MAIVALWAAVLIPMWLRRHDDDQARRIERHRVAMGTLARIADEGEAAQTAAARRRRVVLAATATLGALGTAVWIAGLTPGVLSAILWLPFVAYLPAAVISERRTRREAAEEALRERRAARVSRRAIRVAEPATPSEDDVAPSESTAGRSRAQVPAVAWDEVFDQTA